MAVLQLVQRPANRFTVALAYFSDKLQLAAASFHFDSLGQFTASRRRRPADLIQRCFSPDPHQFRRPRFNSSASRLISLFTDPDNFIVFVFDVITGNVVEPVFGCLSQVRPLKKRPMLPASRCVRTENGSLLDFRETLYIMAAFAMKVIHKLKRSVRFWKKQLDSAGVSLRQIGWAEVAVKAAPPA